MHAGPLALAMHVPLSAAIKRACPSKTAQFLVGLLIVDDIIAMSAAGHCLEVGRAIKMTDAQSGEIVCDSYGVGKIEASVKLNDRRRADH
jgi:hypothetical protein